MRSEVQIIPGTVVIGAAGAGNLNINLPNHPTLVERIIMEMTSINMLVDIQRSDGGTQIITRGAVKCGLLGAQVINVYQGDSRLGVLPFMVDANTQLSFNFTDLSGAPNTVYVAVYCRAKLES